MTATDPTTPQPTPDEISWIGTEEVRGSVPPWRADTPEPSTPPATPAATVPGRYRKKHIEVQAIQFTGTNIEEIWDLFGTDGIYGPTETNPDHLILTTTHSDPAPARAGDWVVPDSKPGTFYPIKPDVFEATYEPAATVPAGPDPHPDTPEDVLAAEVTKLLAGQAEVTAERDRLRGDKIVSVVMGHHRGAPRPFALYRRSDETGVSGTGVVAEGCAFNDGSAVLRWLSDWPTSVVFHDRGIEAIEQVHGHGGATQVVWMSDELPPLAEMEQERDDARAELATARRDAADAERDRIDAAIRAMPCPDPERPGARVAADVHYQWMNEVLRVIWRPVPGNPEPAPAGGEEHDHG